MSSEGLHQIVRTLYHPGECMNYCDTPCFHVGQNSYFTKNHFSDGVPWKQKWYYGAVEWPTDLSGKL